MKTINCCGVTIELTTERTKRVISAIIETQGKLDKELSYSEDLQKKDRVEFYQNHIKKLQAMLS